MDYTNNQNRDGQKTGVSKINRTNKKRSIFALLVLSAFLLASVIAGIMIGSVKASISDLLNYLSGKRDILGYIIYNVRIPRTIAAAVAGASLAVSGLLLQTYFRNPLAGPYVLGISSAASFGVALYVLAGVSLVPNFYFGMMMPAFIASALAGSLLATLLILAVATKVKSAVSLLIVGLMLGYMFSAVDQILITFANAKRVQLYVLWSFGTFSGVTWGYLWIMSVILIPCLILSVLLSKPLNAMLLGENYAKTMGVNVKFIRVMIVLLSAVFAAVVTAYCGIVAFVGLAVPHIAKLALKASDHRLLIPATALAGAAITVACDVAARMLLSPVELPISVITSLFGAPVVVYLVLERRFSV